VPVSVSVPVPDAGAQLVGSSGRSLVAGAGKGVDECCCSCGADDLSSECECECECDGRDWSASQVEVRV
jgi:hypothetical protein